jgi:hypothetical protein
MKGALQSAPNVKALERQTRHPYKENRLYVHKWKFEDAVAAAAGERKQYDSKAAATSMSSIIYGESRRSRRAGNMRRCMPQ